MERVYGPDLMLAVCEQAARLAGRYLRNNPRFMIEILRRRPRILPAEALDA